MTIDAKKLEETIAHFECLDRVYLPSNARLVIEAAKAHLATLPRTKEVEVWRIEFALNGAPRCETYISADGARKRSGIIRGGHAFPHDRTACVKVTGPHLQEVPST